MSVACLSLDAIERGEYSAPAEQASVNVINGPWQQPRPGTKMFRRNKGESVEAWRKKVPAEGESCCHESSTGEWHTPMPVPSYVAGRDWARG